MVPPVLPCWLVEARQQEGQAQAQKAKENWHPDRHGARQQTRDIKLIECVCNYAALRFLPYPETGEFVNLGVAVHCSTRFFFATRMETEKERRVADFFEGLDIDAFRGARDDFAAELRRVEGMAASRNSVEFSRQIFLELVRPRESLFRFGEIRTALTHDPSVLTGRLFDRYVNQVVTDA